MKTTMATRSKEKGATAKASNGKSGFSLISHGKFLQLYTAMLRCRMLEERAGVFFKPSRFRESYDSAAGQEAAVVGVTIDLSPEDTICPSRREFIANFVKGAPLEETFCRLLAGAASPKPRRSSMAHMRSAPSHIVSPFPTIASRLHIASGVALACKKMKSGRIAVAFSDAGAAPMDCWDEALNFAGENRLPVIFVCQNDPRTQLAARKRKGKVEEIAAKAQAYGIPGITVDGNDVLAVYRVASEAIQHARNDGGPTLIDCKTSCRCEHLGNGAAKFRNPGDGEDQCAHDPILNMEKYLAGKGIESKRIKADVAAAFSKELDTAVRAAANPRRI